MGSPERTLHVDVHQEDDGTYWAEVRELPGCFASGHDLEELKEAVLEAIALYVGDDDSPSAEQTRTLRVDQMLVSLG